MSFLGEPRGSGLGGLGLVQTVTQRCELGVEGGGDAAAEGSVEILGEVSLLQPRVRVDREQLVEVGGGHVNTVEVQVLHARDAADRGLHRSGLAVDAADAPADDARVLAEPGPQEPAVRALAEPVDLEDAGSPGEEPRWEEPTDTTLSLLGTS